MPMERNQPVRPTNSSWPIVHANLVSKPRVKPSRKCPECICDDSLPSLSLQSRSVVEERRTCHWSCSHEVTNLELDVSWHSSFSFSLVATIRGLYWYLDSATLNNTAYLYFAYGMQSLMDTPPNFSYVCNSAVFVRYDINSTKYGTYNFNNKFFISDLQFQPFNGDGLQFGQPNYCTSFFTSGIWMGITSSLLCLGILLFGVHRLMSIKSNDRFDDPKGKPLLIKAQE